MPSQSPHEPKKIDPLPALSTTENPQVLYLNMPGLHTTSTVQNAGTTLYCFTNESQHARQAAEYVLNSLIGLSAVSGADVSSVIHRS